MPWNTETGWDETDEWHRVAAGAQLNCVFSPEKTVLLCWCVASVVCIPGTAVGAADEGAEAGSEAKEGAGAALQPATHRVQPHALWDADAGHTRSQLPAAQSHGEGRDFRRADR